MPSKLLGILACGKPVIGIAPEGSELGNVLDNYGIRLSRESSALMAESIIELANNSVLRKRLSERSKNYILNFQDQRQMLFKCF